MDYTPRFYQPFTLREAIALDVSVINEEISRLQNSLQKLDETQIILKEEQHDPDIKKAYEENNQVIGSQKERIAILKMALTEKGIVAGPHYDLQPAQPASQFVNDQPLVLSGTEHARDDISNEDGVFL
ncbi:hypothetical protein CVT25_010993 [Psilocybe cyanescens]|uniref:Uncharacterized protein n=1 Tax=Psilocybe cyanescens TaxID=93625 RepID=A0A409WG10_PSICY|nr:hypothetical protein CVT25_010993 [Psilocybe cyanescens]